MSVGRVVVGVNGSLSSLEALRAAVQEAQREQVELLAVLAWTPVGGEAGYRRAPSPDLLGLWERMACLQLRNSFDEAFGGYPSGVVVRPSGQDPGREGQVAVVGRAVQGDRAGPQRDREQ